MDKTVRKVFNQQTDRPIAVEVHNGKAWVTLADGRIISTPLALHPWLESATSDQLKDVEFDAFSVWWPDLDEGLDVEWMLRESGLIRDEE